MLKMKFSALENGNIGLPQSYIIYKEYVSELLNMGLSVKCIAKPVGDSRCALLR